MAPELLALEGREQPAAHVEISVRTPTGTLDLAGLDGMQRTRGLGAVRQQAPYPRFVGQSMPVPSGAPVLGADTDAVLAELGQSAADIERLRAEGVVG